MSHRHIPRLAFTPGEPAGIGPDLCLQLAQQDLPYQLIVIANANLFQQRALELKLPIQIKAFDSNAKRTSHVAGSLTVINIDLATAVISGKTNLLNSPYV